MGELVTGLGTKLYAAKLINLSTAFINIILFRVVKTRTVNLCDLYYVGGK